MQISVKSGNSYILVDLEVIKKILLDLYQKTEEIYIDMAIMTAKAHFKSDKAFIENVYFISKLIQLEASGKVKPPLNFGTLYRSIVNSYAKSSLL